MYCPKCGVQNSEGSIQCTNCGQVLIGPAATPVQAPAETIQAKTSKLAVWSMILGLLTIFCVTWPIFGPLAIILGIIALVKINKHKPYLKGTGLAVTGIAIPTVMLLLLPFIAMIAAILMPALATTKQIAQRTVCGVNVKGLATAVTVYVNDFNEFPARNWCDLLIEETDVDPKSLVCPQSDDIAGECSYAMNKNIAGVPVNKVPADVVLLFETNIGLEDGPRNTTIRTRRHYNFLNQFENSSKVYDEELLVHERRFNQYGGPEDLLLRHNTGGGQLGCNIAFADGHTEFVTEDRIPSLRWAVE